MSADVAIAHEPGVAKPDPVLTIDGMSRAFGGLRAVDIDHLEIQRNTITSIIGPERRGEDDAVQPAHRLRVSRPWHLLPRRGRR